MHSFTTTTMMAFVAVVCFFVTLATVSAETQLSNFPIQETWFQCQLPDKKEFTVKDLTSFPTEYQETATTKWTLPPRLVFNSASPRDADRVSMVLWAARESQSTSTRSEFRFPNMIPAVGKWYRFAVKMYIEDESVLGEFTIAQLHLKPSTGTVSTPPLRIAYERSRSVGGVTYTNSFWAVWRPPGPGSDDYVKNFLFQHPGKNVPVSLSIYITGGTTVGTDGVVVEWYDHETSQVKSIIKPIDITAWNNAGEYYYKTGVYCSGSTNWNAAGNSSVEIIELQLDLASTSPISKHAWFTPTDDEEGPGDCEEGDCTPDPTDPDPTDPDPTDPGEEDNDPSSTLTHSTVVMLVLSLLIGTMAIFGSI